jgi:hypothetical protein
MQVYQCPICEREQNRRGDPFTDPEQVVSHITGSHRAGHQGERGESYRDDLEPVERSESDVEPAGSGSPGVAEVRRSLERDIDRLEDEVDRLEREGNNATGELYELVEEQREMIGELVEVVEVLTLVADGTELKNASAAHENGAEVPIDWRGPAHEFVSAQYR